MLTNTETITAIGTTSEGATNPATMFKIYLKYLFIYLFIVCVPKL